MKMLKGTITQLNRAENFGIIVEDGTNRDFLFYPDEVPSARKLDVVTFQRDTDYIQVDVAIDVEVTNRTLKAI